MIPFLHMFTLQQLAGFVAVAEELHFGRAAVLLHMTQPPLTRQVQSLERELGVELFDRTGRNIKLTPAGRAFLGDARRLLRGAEAAVLAVRRVPSGELGSISIGFTAAAAPAVLGPLIASMRNELPRVDILLHEMVTSAQLDALSGAVLDLGMVRPPVTRPELSSCEILRERLVVALPKSHELSGSELLRVEDLDGQRVVMPSPTDARYFHELSIALFRAAGISVQYSQHVTQIHSIIALVEAGVGLALVPESAARRTSESVSFHRLLTDDPTPVRLHLAWRTDNPNPSLRATLKVALDTNG